MPTPTPDGWIVETRNSRGDWLTQSYHGNSQPGAMLQAQWWKAHGFRARVTHTHLKLNGNML